MSRQEKFYWPFFYSCANFYAYSKCGVYPSPHKPCIRIDLAIQVGEGGRRQAIWLENLIFLKFDI